jgi:hypothetical protein
MDADGATRLSQQSTRMGRAMGDEGAERTGAEKPPNLLAKQPSPTRGAASGYPLRVQQ